MANQLGNTPIPKRASILTVEFDWTVPEGTPKGLITPWIVAHNSSKVALANYHVGSHCLDSPYQKALSLDPGLTRGSIILGKVPEEAVAVALVLTCLGTGQTLHMGHLTDVSVRLRNGIRKIAYFSSPLETGGSRLALGSIRRHNGGWTFAAGEAPLSFLAQRTRRS